MLGILLSFVYAVYAQFTQGFGFVQIHLIAMDFLFQWYAYCFLAFVVTLVLLIGLSSLGLRFPTWVEETIISLLGISNEPTTMGKVIGLRTFRTVLLLGGTYLLQHAFPLGQFAFFLYFGGVILILLGALWGLRLNLRANLTRTITIRKY